MVFRSSEERFLFSEIRKGREGVQLERTFRALLFLLHGWCTFTGKRKPLYERKEKIKEDIEPLPVIHFEKLALFVSRIWKKMYDIASNKIRKIEDSSTQIKDAEVVTFPFPFLEYPAKHGRRLRKLNGRGKRISIVQILHELQKEDIHYFEITTPSDDSDNPNNYRTVVATAFPILNRKEFLQDFTSLEFEILEDLENSLRHLGASQIRALGTHENKEKTIYDIKKEFRDMDRHILHVINSLKRDGSFFDDSYEIMIYADEAWRKSIDNRGDYAEACKLMLAEIKNSQLRASFRACQSLPEQIWRTDQIINDLAQISKKTKAFTKYLYAIAYHRDHIAERTARKSMTAPRFGHLWNESLKEINQSGFKGFPSDISNIFIDNTSKIKPEVRDRLLRELESLRAWIKENTKHA